MKQLLLIPNRQRLFSGGELALGKRKSKRTLSHKRPIHLVLRARKDSLFENRKTIQKIIKKYAKRFGMKIYSFSVQQNHIHACIRIHNRPNYNSFIRTVTGQIAKAFGKGLWKVAPFTRVTTWGKGFRQVLEYIEKNTREVHGLQPYKPRRNYYRHLLETG